jgi:hypothetical protein
LAISNDSLSRNGLANCQHYAGTVLLQLPVEPVPGPADLSSDLAFGVGSGAAALGFADLLGLLLDARGLAAALGLSSALGLAAVAVAGLLALVFALVVDLFFAGALGLAFALAAGAAAFCLFSVLLRTFLPTNTAAANATFLMKDLSNPIVPPIDKLPA